MPSTKRATAPLAATEAWRAATARARRCFSRWLVRPRKCNLLTGECVGESHTRPEQLPTDVECSRWGRDQFHVDFELYQWGQDLQHANTTTMWGLVNSQWRCGNITCNVALSSIGPHRQADGSVLPFAAGENECSWFAWVRGPRTQEGILQTHDFVSPFEEGDPVSIRRPAGAAGAMAGARPTPRAPAHRVH